MLQPEKTCLLIADISGYTEYLAGVEIDHAQDILADLIGTVVTSLRPNFRLSKLEGDAAFCFAPADKVDGSMLLDTIEHCYFGFRRRRRDVRQATSCECNACMRIPDLNLKFVAHHGLVIRQKIYGHEELLGSDVIAVHRLLKNDIIERTGATAYAALTDRLVREMGIDPAAMGMREHVETYEHIGEIAMWVLDLEKRWQEEDSRKRVYVSASEAIFVLDAEIAAPPQVVWEFVTTPGRRLEWQSVGGVTAVKQSNGAAGRRGVGTVNHCMHGPAAQVEEILDWRPFDYFSFRATMPGGGPTAVSMYEMEPTPTGTALHFRMAPPKTAKDRKALEQMGPHISVAFKTSLDELASLASDETAVLKVNRAEPALPKSRNADGFLEGIEPIHYVG
jgi:uncharacterized protein YndB with AHSA1/START domain